jgi:hypothetical protein
MRANMKLVAGLLLAIAFAAPALAQNEDPNSQPRHVAPERPVTKLPQTPCVLCMQTAQQNLIACQKNARTNSDKAACNDAIKNATANCNSRFCGLNK